VWKIQVTTTNWRNEVWEIHVAAPTLLQAYDRAMVAAWKAKRWKRSECDAKLVERLDLKVYV
jgi:hypothetical protein